MSNASPTSDSELCLTDNLVAQLRTQFPSLERRIGNQPATFLDGPAGTQVPHSVIDAISDYLRHRNANHGGCFATSLESDEELDETHRAVSDLLGAEDPGTISFGPNMTTLTFAMSRAISRTWKPGDEILLTRVEHDANFTPWVLAANDMGVQVQVADLRTTEATLDVQDWMSKLNSRTRLVAIGAASNATGARTPIAQLCRAAREVGALSFIDAVHFAPHAAMDVEQIGCDLLVCSAYKFFGPHIGVQFGRRELLEQLQPYKLRTSPNTLPGRWMTGTQSHEGLAGTRAAVEYLADVGRAVTGGSKVLARRIALRVAMGAIELYERRLCQQLLRGLEQIPGIRVWGITDPERGAERLPTVSITSERHRPAELARLLAVRGIFVWHGNYYALPLTERLGVEPDGMVRLGLVHYNTAGEVERVLEALGELCGG